MSLSSFNNKIVLLDFWASWCFPCRNNNKDLSALYQKYRHSRFEILSFSVDTDFNSWKTASQKDSISWTNISDLKGLYSKEAASYKIRAIPKAFLIDQNKKIVRIFNGFSENHSKEIETEIQRMVQ